MGKIFDELVGLNNSQYKNFLIERGFYENCMNPRFINGFEYENLSIGEKCLRNDIFLKEYTLRIFINNIDIYYELESPWRSYETSGRYDAKNYLEIEDMDKLLDEIVLNVRHRI